MASPAASAWRPVAPARHGGDVFPTNSGAFPMTMPGGITAGADGNVWFTDSGTPSGIGRVTPGGDDHRVRSGERLADGRRARTR